MSPSGGRTLGLLLLFNITVTLYCFLVSDANLDLTFTANSLMNGRHCSPGDLITSINAYSTISCVHVCTRQFNSSSVFHNLGAGVCHCCSQNYTSPGGNPSEEGTVYFSTAPSSFNDCLHAQASGVHTSGVQSIITPLTGRTIDVFCDMDTAGGGWLVFQNRFNGNVDFYRNFTDYNEGFGDVRGEFWLGLQYIHELTVQSPSLVYLHFVDVDDTTAFEMFQGFNISTGPEYTLNLGDCLDANDGTVPPGYSGGFVNLDGVGFSTPDVDRDRDPDKHCAEHRHSGWWHSRCTSINVNGRYETPGTQSDYSAMIHTTWKNLEALKATRVMFRRLQ